MFLTDAQKLINFFGYDALTNLFIEKARACSFLPSNFEGLDDLSYYLECENQTNYISWLKTDPQVPSIVKEYAQNVKFHHEYDQYIFGLFEFSLPSFINSSCVYGKRDPEKESLEQLKQLEGCLKQDNILKYIGEDIHYRKFSITLKPMRPFINYSELENKTRQMYLDYASITGYPERRNIFCDAELDLKFNDSVDPRIVPELFEFVRTRALYFNVDLASWRHPDSPTYTKDIHGGLEFMTEEYGSSSVYSIKTTIGSALKILAGG